MSQQQDTTTQPQEETKPVETEAPVVPEQKDDTVTQPTPTEQTVADELGLEVPKKKAKPETVPFSKYESVKKELRELQADIARGQTVDVEDLADLSKKYEVSMDFISDLFKVVDKKTSEKYEARLSEFDKKAREEKINQAFESSFDKALTILPEYSKIVNKEVIKTLSLDPRNHNKTMSQLIKEIYGNAIPGSKPMETATPGTARQEGDELDIARAKTDAVYFKEIMADPVKKEQYNRHLRQNIRL